jgi:CBS domain-containing protein
MAICRKELEATMQVRDIMTTDVVTIRRDTSVNDIAKLMRERDIGGIPVVDDARHVVGIVTELDMIVRNTRLELPTFIQVLDLARIPLELPGQYTHRLRHMLGTHAADIMTEEVVTISPDAEVEDLAEVMVKHRFNPVPVVENEVLVGIVSRADLIRMMAHELE